MRIESREPITFASPDEAIKVLRPKLNAFEDAYNRKSAEFYRWYRGDISKPNLELAEWASTYELYLEFVKEAADSFLEGGRSGGRATRPGADVQIRRATERWGTRSRCP